MLLQYDTPRTVLICISNSEAYRIKSGKSTDMDYFKYLFQVMFDIDKLNEMLTPPKNKTKTKTKTKQNKTKQNKTKQNKTKQNKTKKRER